MKFKCKHCGNDDKTLIKVLESRPVDFKIYCEVCSKESTVDRDHE